jgi:hypothetical protein
VVRRVAIGIVAGIVAAGQVWVASAQTSRPADPLSPSHAVKGNTLQVDVGTIKTVDVSRSFRYAGGHRFILKGVADAEQHAFAEADPTGQIQRFVWFQFESLLPAATGAYDYSKDAAVTIGGREWRSNVRRYTTPPAPDGDQAQLYALFARRNLRPALPALRVRLVHVPPGDRRAELMIIYTEATESAAAPTSAETAGIIARAQAVLRFHP